MPNISLKNRGTGPRAVIDVKGKAVTLPVDPNRDFEPVEVEVDEVTELALQEGSEAGGDLEVSGGVAKRSSSRSADKEKENEATGRAKMRE